MFVSGVQVGEDSAAKLERKESKVSTAPKQYLLGLGVGEILMNTRE